MNDTKEFLSRWDHYEQVSINYEPDIKTVWYALQPKGRPCFNLDLLRELRRFQHRVEQFNQCTGVSGCDLPLRYMVLESNVPGVFNLGGDLELFLTLIERGDRDALFRYAKACIDVLFPNSVNFEMPMTTISLVQGEALGGGMEAAISSNVVIAEKSARFGLPEVLFNLIPGMGAYSFLIRRTTPDIAERLILSGKILTADEMYDLKLIDVVAEDGQGHEVVREYINEHSKRQNAHSAMTRVRQCINPITYEELIRITGIWVETALQLTPRDVRMIQHLVRAQNQKVKSGEKSSGRALEGQG
jgi:DSF synthase